MRVAIGGHIVPVFVLSVQAARWPHARLRIRPRRREERAPGLSFNRRAKILSPLNSPVSLISRVVPLPVSLCARSSRRSPLSPLAPSPSCPLPPPVSSFRGRGPNERTNDWVSVVDGAQ